MRNRTWGQWWDEEGGCLLVGLGILAGAIWWLGWQTVLAILLLLLIATSPLLFALLEPEDELKIRLAALNYGVTIAFALFLFVSELTHLPHRYNLLEWTIGLGFMVGATNAILAWIWFQKLRVISIQSTRRLENQARRSTIAVGLTIASIVVLAILGSCTLRPRMQTLHYWEKESRELIRWIHFQSAVVFPEKHILTLTFETYGKEWPAPDTISLYISPGAGEKEEEIELTPCSVWIEEQPGICQFNVSLSPSYFTGSPDEWKWKLYFHFYGWGDYRKSKFHKPAGESAVYEMTGYDYNILTNGDNEILQYRGSQVIEGQ